MCKQTIFPNHLHQRGTLSKGSFGKPDYFIPSDPGTIKLSILFFFLSWTDMSHGKNKHRIKVLTSSDPHHSPPHPRPPEVTVSHTPNPDYTHFAHTCSCFNTIIPTTKWRGETPPPGLQSHTLSIFHTNGAYSPLETLPPSVFIICVGAFEASWGRPTDTCVVGRTEAWFWYLQRFHLDGTAAAPAAGRPSDGLHDLLVPKRCRFVADVS